MAHHRNDDLGFLLPASGSYPSGHALLGMVAGLTLSQVAPDRTDALMARGVEFGESRLICGFHYPSDLVAGRLAGSVLFSTLIQTPAFDSDLAGIRKAKGKSE
jgi:acid phosphatase (class A)